MWMGILDAAKGLWNSAVKKVKSWFTNDEEETTTPVQVTTTTPTTPTNQPTLNDVANTIDNQQQQNILNADPLWTYNNKVQAQQEVDLINNQETPDPIATWFIGNQNDIVDWDVNKYIDKEKSDKKKSWWQTAVDGVVSFWDWLWDLADSLNASSDYDANKKDMAMYYDKDSWDIYYLDINTSHWLADWDTNTYDWAQTLFDKAMAEYQQEDSQALDDNWRLEALRNFYNKTKNLFRLRADDYYSDGWFFTWQDGQRIGRRKDQYSDETLEKLANNKWVDKATSYIPTFEEFVEYLNVLQDNNQLKQDIYWNYWLDADKDETTIDLSQSATEAWKSGFYNSAMDGVMDYAKTYLNENDSTKAILNAADAVTSQSNRIYNIVAEVYKQEQIVLAKPENERNDWDKAILEAANKLRQMEEVYAKDLGSVVRQNIKYWSNSNWELSENIDAFEGWLTLNQALTNNIKQIAWGDWSKRESAIDVFQEVANKALFDYNKDNKGLWAYWQRFFEKGWTYLSELWQQGVYVLMWVRNVLADIATLDFEGLQDKLSWGSPFTTTGNYMDNDFTIGRLLQTDMGNNTRTIYKYYLNGLEYVPEGVGNLAPDIALTLATWWTWAVTSWIRWMWKANSAIKSAKAAWLIGKLQKAAEVSNVAKSALTWLERVTALAKAAENVNPTIRIWGQMLDAAITRWIVDQAIDAQWSQFDTEPYSNTSMLLSLMGTWLWEIFPLIWQTWWIQKLFGQTWMFDIVDYAKKNADGLAKIAKAMNTTASDITFQDLRTYLRSFDEISEAAKQVYNQLSNEGKVAADKWSKDVLYNYLNQFFNLDSQSSIAKNMRSIVTNGSTNIADLVKYVGKIPWTVEFWPYVSTIQLKNWTKATVMGDYDKALDTIDGWFASKINWGFTQWDLTNINKIADYSDVLENKNKYFREVDGKYYLTNEGLNRFKLSAENQWLASLWVELAEAENVKEIFKEKMKAIRTSEKAITDETVDAIADSWAYSEVVEKIKEVVC